MNDYRELSRMPDDPSYWEGLEDRIMTDLGPIIRAGGTEGLFTPIASRAAGLAVLAAAAMLAAVLLAPARPASTELETGFLHLPSADPAVVDLVSTPAPPELGSLVLPQTRRGQ